mmetsp:Transcript_19541/g.34862  ORF Transcript_19541/g.34862 Transcript_19541/m.34862 type:complete len:390 (-) Transcript_19541:56-1225(-)
MWYLAHSRQYCMWLVLWPLALTRTCYSSDTTNTNNKNDWYSDAAGPHLVRTSVLDFPLAPPVQGSHAVWYPIGLDTPLPVYFYMSGTNMKPSSYHQTLELVASYGIAVVGVANTFKFGGLTTCGYLTGVSSFSNSVTLMIESLKNGTLRLPGAITTDASKIAVGGHSGGGACALWAASDLGKDIAGLVSEHAGQIHGGNMVSAAGMRQISAASLVMCGAYDTMPACGCPVAKGVIFDRLQAPKYFVNDTIPCPTATDNLRAHKLCHVGFAGQPQGTHTYCVASVEVQNSSGKARAGGIVAHFLAQVLLGAVGSFDLPTANDSGAHYITFSDIQQPQLLFDLPVPPGLQLAPRTAGCALFMSIAMFYSLRRTCSRERRSTPGHVAGLLSC